MYSTSFLDKLRWSLPWLVNYPRWKAIELVRRLEVQEKQAHIVILVANHYEPGLGESALRRVEKWCQLARATGDAVRDHDGTPFRHTNFFPAEQYETPLLDALASLQADGYGEVEIHLHHGIDKPDTASNTRNVLETFRDTLAERHKCLSRENPGADPKYAFVHGNWALANSAGGRYCGVDSEMQILADTGCYADFTLPSAPDESQVPRINAIYQCGNPLSEARPHRSGPELKVGSMINEPVIFTGPLVFDWQRQVHGIPVPRIDDGALAKNYPLSLDRFQRWRRAHIGVVGRPDWVFVKLYCHGFFDWDQDTMIGEGMRRFLNSVMDLAERTGSFKVHFATTREAYNMVLAAVAGESGNPNDFRNYRLRQVMREFEGQEPVEHGRESVVALR
jgi:hypothetical protein